MNSTLPKTLTVWVATLAFSTISSCSYVEEVDSPKSTKDLSLEGNIIVRIPAFSIETIAGVKTIELFQFSEGRFVKKMTVDASRTHAVEFPAKRGTRIYALAGYSLEGTQILDENDFSTITIPVPEDSHSAPVFFSSITDPSYFTEDPYIELLRGVARLDIDNEDPDLQIEQVNISGAASSSQIFPIDGRTYEMTTSSYSRTYQEGIQGIEERAFILFETSSPITVTVSGRRNGEPVEIVSQTPAIVRNTIYTVCIQNEEFQNNRDRQVQQTNENPSEEDAPCASIRVRNWEKGDSQSAAIDLQESAIDMGRSSIPSGVSINPVDNTVTVPADGVSGMKLAFVTSAPLRLGSVLSDTEGVSVTPLDPEATEDGYISVFSIDVAKQPKGATRYQTAVFFKGSSSFFCNIEVAPSPFQIPTVHIGGHDWMCFNAVSQDPEEQIYVPKGMTVEKMYSERFVECFGNMFQYGRPNPFSPWKAYDPNLYAGSKRDDTWATKSMMPLPKGFHVPSAAEWEDLIPNGTVIPASYRTACGDSIRATIVTYPGTIDSTPSEATNAQNYLKRGVLFESISTGARLLLPMGGIKTDISCEIPTHPKYRLDTRSGYWMKENQNAMLLDYMKLGDSSEGIQMGRHHWSADGFVMVRGIKD
ncbi:MAG: hypothetical protein K2M16_10375 [Muribaculaceae bacterium]|nr:hypothetical protein [Muribaculaceae bacterium]